MSGHSKWATTKYRKGAQDSARAKVFAKIIRQVEVAAREGGSDMTANASLRTMYAKAARRVRTASTPSSGLSSGASGELEGVRYESIAYEGYAPAGVARHRRVPHRQSEPHRRGDPQPVQQERGEHGRARIGELAVRAQGNHRRSPHLR